MTKYKNLSVVIPAYNEAGNISSIINELFSVLKNIPDLVNYQIVVVDDHSSDATYNEVERIDDPRVVCIRLSRRGGSHTALRAGLKQAKGEAVIAISADGQDSPGCFKDMLEKWSQGANIVWALRRDRKGEPWYVRKPAQLFYRALFWLLNKEEQNIDLSRADFFLLDRKVVDSINSCPERNTSLFGLIVWLGFKQESIEYERRARLSGKSKWNFRSRFHLAKDWIIAFSGLPLRFASFIGMVMSSFGILGAVYVIINKLFFSKIITGWTSIVTLVLILGGLQLTILGIIGEYLWRNLDESRKRPLFFIERRSDA